MHHWRGFLFFLTCLLWNASPLIAAKEITIHNSCPQAITWFVNGQSRGDLSPGATSNETINDDFSGVIYTSANGGSTNGVGALKAGFYGPTGYYYIVKDSPSISVGVSIAPSNPSTTGTGFCSITACDSIGCSGTYDDLPSSFPAPSAAAPPSPPLFECSGAQVGFTVTFCPERTFPPSVPFTAVHPLGMSGKCIDVRGATYRDGTPVQIFDCNGTGAQRWATPARGTNGTISVAGTHYCLDAGSNPQSGTLTTIRPCADGSDPAQVWQLTGSDEIKHAATNQCLDLTNGITLDGNQLQTWECAAGNPNQRWSLN